MADGGFVGSIHVNELAEWVDGKRALDLPPHRAKCSTLHEMRHRSSKKPFRYIAAESVSVQDLIKIFRAAATSWRT